MNEIQRKLLSSLIDYEISLLPDFSPDYSEVRTFQTIYSIGCFKALVQHEIDFGSEDYVHSPSSVRNLENSFAVVRVERDYVLVDCLDVDTKRSLEAAGQIIRYPYTEQSNRCTVLDANTTKRQFKFCYSDCAENETADKWIPTEIAQLISFQLQKIMNFDQKLETIIKTAKEKLKIELESAVVPTTGFRCQIYK